MRAVGGVGGVHLGVRVPARRIRRLSAASGEGYAGGGAGRVRVMGGGGVGAGGVGWA
jgi:hypothetical protein